jgi:hypothetical protein
MRWHKKINPFNSSDEKSSLIIHKDFSELDITIAAQFLEKISINTEKIATIICANEGRLRAVIAASKASPISGRFTKYLMNLLNLGFVP